MKPCLLAVVLLALLVAHPSLRAQAGSSSPEYLPAFRPLQTGKAPRMKVQLLGDKNGLKTYAVIFGTGDEILAGLSEFAGTYHLRASSITGIGALSGATLGWLDPTRRMYCAIRVSDQVEVTSLLGDIAVYNGKPTIHAHLNLGHGDGSVTGGHLLEAFVRPTLEVMVTEYPNGMVKQLDPDSGMALIRPDLAR